MLERVRLGLAVALLSMCFLFGGASRSDVPGLLVLQPGSVVIGALALVLPGPMRWSAIRTPLVFLGAFGIWMSLQLVPLPPAIWQALPGQAQFIPYLAEAGAADAWRPISLTPDLTVATVVGLTVPLAALIVMASLTEDQANRFLVYTLAAIGLSALVGIGQLAAGSDSALYRYAITNEGAAVGLFANRNHQAVALAMAWPMLAVWTVGTSDGAGKMRGRLVITAAATVALVPLTIATGSRGGLGLSAIGISMAGLVLWRRRELADALPKLRGVSPRLALLILVGIIAVVVAATMMSSRNEGLQRLAEIDVGDELRFQFFPLILQITAQFLPFGAGFGSFDPLFRYYEPAAMVGPQYLNHAHNDWLELVLTGGVPAALLAIAFCVWAARKAVSARVWTMRTRHQRMAFLGVSMIALLVLASALDYPLRTPIHALLLALASVWLASTQPSTTRR